MTIIIIFNNNYYFRGIQRGDATCIQCCSETVEIDILDYIGQETVMMVATKTLDHEI